MGKFSSKQIVFIALASVVLLGCIQFFYPFIPLIQLSELGISPKPEDVQKHRTAYLEFYSLNGTILFAAIGLALAISIGNSFSRRRLTGILAGAIAGVALGATGGYFAGLMVHQTTWLSQDESIGRNFGIHLVAWGPTIIGAVAGVSFTQFGLTKAIIISVASFIPAIMVVASYCLATSLVFFNNSSTQLLPNQVSQRVLWIFTASISFALGLKLTVDAIGRAPNSEPIHPQTDKPKL
ncbi:MAG: hypothetical protein U0930_14590 [Pirellulales bacterium]